MSARALSNQQIARAAGVVLLGFISSGALGLIRTAIFAGTFGTSEALDAFYAAQRIPETLFVLVAGGALGSSFIPVFARYLNKDDKDSAWRLASAVMTLSAMAATVLAVFVGIFAPQLVPALLVPGKSPLIQALTIDLTRIMIVTVVIFSVSGLLMGILNAHQVFTLPALALSMNNIGLIIGALIIARLIPVDPAWIYRLGDVNSVVGTWGRLAQPSNIYGLAYGAVLAALLHLAIQLPALPRVHAHLRFLPDRSVAGVAEVLRLMGPRVLGLGVVQINFMVNVALSSDMKPGSYTALITAFTLMFFALGIIAQSVGTAVFPSLSALAASGDMVGFKERLGGALRGVLFLALPLTVGLIVLGQAGISVLFERGAWTADSSAATAWALGFFAVGIAGFGALEILSRAFYALSNTRVPVIAGVISMVGNILLSLIFIRVIGDPDSLTRGPFGGLALANALTTLLEALALWRLLRQKIGPLQSSNITDLMVKAGIASGIMGLAVFFITRLTENMGPLITLAVGGSIGVAVFFVSAYMLHLEEARTIPTLVLKRLRGRQAG